MPALNMLLKRYSQLSTDTEELKSLDQLKIGPFRIRKSSLYTGLRLAMEKNGVEIGDLSSPTKEELEKIFNFKSSLRHRAQRSIGPESRGVALVGMDEFPFKELTGVISPLVTSALTTVVQRNGKSNLPPAEYMHEELRDVDLILVDNNFRTKNTIMSYLVSLGLDIEVVGLNPDGSTDIEKLNEHRAQKPRGRKKPYVFRVEELPSPIADSKLKEIQRIVGKKLGGSVIIKIGKEECESSASKV